MPRQTISPTFRTSCDQISRSINFGDTRPIISLHSAPLTEITVTMSKSENEETVFQVGTIRGEADRQFCELAQFGEIAKFGDLRSYKNLPLNSIVTQLPCLIQSHGRWQKAKQKFRFTLSTHWGRVTHICVSKLTIIGSDNGLSPGRRQAIIRTNAGILLIGPLGTNFSEILVGNQTFSFRKMHLKMSSALLRPFCLGLNELNIYLVQM